MILNGKKRYEFRRVIFKLQSVTGVVLYASSPIRRVVGEFEIDGILSLGVAELWARTKEHSGIDRDSYESYFAGRRMGYAIKIKNVKRYPEYKEIREFNIRHTPQSFTYIS